MSDSSTNLSLPYILPSQAQKHVTHNEALAILDAVVQLVVTDRDRSAPPDQPEPGARHIVGAAAAGPWAGQEGQVAVWMDSHWSFLSPRPGWRAWILSEARELLWQEGAWGDVPLPVLENLDGLGVQTSADAVNRLAVSSDASLFSHAGAGHQLKINKSAPTQTASLLFQSDWSGRAEMGLAGSDGWSVKVSPDGTAWTEALTLDATTGLASGTAVQAQEGDATAGRLLRVGAFGWGASAPTMSGAAITDMDALKTPGLWTVDGAVANTPDGTSTRAGICLVMQRAFGTSGMTQLLSYDFESPDLWVRVGSGDPTVWSAWRALYTQENLLGAVSQSGGVPTGAVIERGSGSNGSYTRLADGTQRCLHTMTLERVNNNQVNALWTFPASFSSPPVISATTRALGYDANPEIRSLGPPTVGELGNSVARVGLRTILGTSENFEAGDTVTVLVRADGYWYD